MAKLIGTDPNQVPTNADLGTMAYQDYDVVDKEFRNSRPNLVINGDFQVWQRSDNAYTSSNGYISVDRIKSTRGRIRKPNTNGNSGEDDRGCILDTTDGSVYVHFDMFIEDVGQKLAGKEAIMSFEAKAISPSSFGLYMENSGYTGHGSLDTGGNNTVTVVDYEWRTIVLRGTITYNGSGEYFRLPRWYVNPTGGNSGQNLQIDKLKVELVEDGYKNPTPFVSKPYHEELAACQRYFNVFPKAALSGGGASAIPMWTGSSTSASTRVSVPGPVMRVRPTATLYGTSADSGTTPPIGNDGTYGIYTSSFHSAPTLSISETTSDPSFRISANSTGFLAKGAAGFYFYSNLTRLGDSNWCGVTLDAEL